MSVDDLKQQIAGLSSVKRALLERRRQQASAPAIRPRPDGNSAPLSFAQQRLWLIYQLDPASHLYNVPRAVRIRGKLNFDALEQNLNQIVSRHEVLRTTFVAGSDQPLQHILSSLRITVAQHDLSSFSPADQEIEIRRRCLDFYRQPFDLAAGPLLRALVLRLGEE